MKNDHRVRLTKLLLHQSLLEMMKEYPLEKITVKDLCEKAGVNRATFYAHYADTEALLAEITDEVIAAIQNSMDNSSVLKTQQEIILEICQSILENKEYCEVLFGRYGDEKFLVRILDTARQQSITLWKKLNPKRDEAMMIKLYTFIAHGSIAIIRLWVQGGMKESPAEIAGFIGRVSAGGLAEL